MTRKYTKKIKVPIESVIEPMNENNCEYRLTLKFNNEVFDCYTNNLKVSMLSFKPNQILTEGYIKIQKGQATFERKYNLVQLKKLMSDEEHLDIFISQLQLG